MASNRISQACATRRAQRRHRLVPLVLIVAAGLLGGCVYDPYSGGYAPGIAAAPVYGYAPGYYPAYGYPAPAVVIGGGWGGGWGGDRHGGWRH